MTKGKYSFFIRLFIFFPLRIASGRRNQIQGRTCNNRNKKNSLEAMLELGRKKKHNDIKGFGPGLILT